MTRAVFLAFEGIDVSGKSTQARRVAAAHDALFTFEPGDTPLGRDLRHWVLDAATPMEPETEALIMLSDRSHHVRSVIEPTLTAGRSVVSDRFFASTLAYQGYGRGVDLALLRAASDLAIGACVPTLTILLDVSLGVVNERRDHDQKDRFEAEDLSFHERVRQGYLELAQDDGWFVVDGAMSEGEVARVIDERVARLPW
ncbi:MAG: thymidylate kinase [Acidimicrobiaceae bacterium]|nr:thymidylate kinase [Acidimicrobiaceae bacterium]